MEKSTLESLPNELLLLIFHYLSSFDLCRTFFEVRNARIQHLLTSMHHYFDVSLMRYNELHQFLSNINDDATKRFTSLVDTIVLRNTPVSLKFVEYWRKMSKEDQSWNMNFSSMKRVVILEGDYQAYLFASSILKPLILPYKILQNIYFLFERPTDSYLSTLEAFVYHCISIRTMIFEVEQGMIVYWLEA